MSESRSRRGEKIGWLGGWLGGFIWLLILSGVWFWQGKMIFGGLGLVSFIAAVAAIFLSAPWKHPDTRYWKLMLPVYLMLVPAIVIAVLAFNGHREPGLNWFYLFLLLPLFSPFMTMGRKTWNTMRGGEKGRGVD